MKRVITLGELDEVFVTPDLYIGNFDLQGNNEIETGNSSAYIASMTRSCYSRSAFLDHRTKTVDGNAYKVNLQKLVDVYNSAKPEIRPIKFVFHTAFCGSTLMCRCLDKPGTSMPYKEPLPVHIYSALKRYRPNYADSMTAPSLVDIVWASVQKTRNSTEIPVVKPTDSCLNIGVELMSYAKGSKGLLMYEPLEAFLVSMLKHDLRRQYVRENLERACMDLKDSLLLSRLDAGTLTDAKIAGLVWLSLMYQIVICSQILTWIQDH